MPIREIINYGMAIFIGLLIFHGPVDLSSAINNLKIKILRETARTDNWGNPSIFAHRSKGVVKSQ